MGAKTSFYTQDGLKNIGFASYGTDVNISRNAQFYAPEKMHIGSHVRIDDFCVLSGNINIGNYVHIAAASLLYGGSAGIALGDFANISSRCAIYAVSDDYSGESMTSPMVPEQYKSITEKPVNIGRHVIVGSGSTILPGVTAFEGSAVGAMSLVTKDIPAFTIVAGVPAKHVKERSKKLLELEKQFLGS